MLTFWHLLICRCFIYTYIYIYIACAYIHIYNSAYAVYVHMWISTNGMYNIYIVYIYIQIYTHGTDFLFVLLSVYDRGLPRSDSVPPAVRLPGVVPWCRAPASPPGGVIITLSCSQCSAVTLSYRSSVLLTRCTIYSAHISQH